MRPQSPGRRLRRRGGHDVSAVTRGLGGPVADCAGPVSPEEQAARLAVRLGRWACLARGRGHVLGRGLPSLECPGLPPPQPLVAMQCLGKPWPSKGR